MLGTKFSSMKRVLKLLFIFLNGFDLFFKYNLNFVHQFLNSFLGQYDSIVERFLRVHFQFIACLHTCGGKSILMKIAWIEFILWFWIKLVRRVFIENFCFWFKSRLPCILFFSKLDPRWFVFYNLGIFPKIFHRNSCCSSFLHKNLYFFSHVSNYFHTNHWFVQALKIFCTYKSDLPKHFKLFHINQ